MQSDPPHAIPPAPGKCSAANLDGLVGKMRSDATEAEAKAGSGATMIRWIRPGDMVTKDFREERLNLDVDAQGKITRAYCG